MPDKHPILINGLDTQGIINSVEHIHNSNLLLLQVIVSNRLGMKSLEFFLPGVSVKLLTGEVQRIDGDYFTLTDGNIEYMSCRVDQSDPHWDEFNQAELHAVLFEDDYVVALLPVRFNNIDLKEITQTVMACYALQFGIDPREK